MRRHDHHRVDAILACAVDHLGTTDTAQAMNRAIDNDALLDMLPLTGRDEGHGMAIAQIIFEAKEAKCYSARDDKAVLCAVAARLAVVACSQSAQHGTGEHSAATLLWRAAGLLSCLAPTQGPA